MEKKKNEVLVGENVIPVTDFSGGLAFRPPETVLAEAALAAKALQSVVSEKKNPVTFGGVQYLEFEDWQTLARFYGVTAKVVSTTFVEYGGAKGFESRAEAIAVQNGTVLSAAEAMCLNDEKTWSTRAVYRQDERGKKIKIGVAPVPMFQLRSMAQTRACAKALRNVLAWVAVLAGYKPTPAEEMDSVHPEETPGIPAAEIEALRKQKALEYAKLPPVVVPPPPPPPPPASNGRTVSGFLTRQTHPNKGGYVSFCVDNYVNENGKDLYFTTADSETIKALAAKLAAGERVAFTYEEVVNGKYTNRNITGILEAEPISEQEVGG